MAEVKHHPTDLAVAPIDPSVAALRSRWSAFKYFEDGVFRNIIAWHTKYYIHVVDFGDANAAWNMDLGVCPDEYIACAGATVSEVVVCGGTRLLLVDEITIYGSESVGDRCLRGILIRVSRY